MRSKIWPCLLLAACVAEEPQLTEQRVQDASVTVRRDVIAGDIAHYELTVPVGTSPNARLRVHRVVRELAPWVPRPSARAALLMHGDFSTFGTNFLTGLAPFLASQNIDAWGLDRRWTLPAGYGDVSDFADMGVAQELDDIGRALALAHAIAGKRLALVGFSHGGQLAYSYAALEGARPPGQRHVDALVPIDFYAAISPADEDLRVGSCEAAAAERDLVAAGVTDSANDFLIAAGELAAAAPDEPSPLIEGLTNRGVLLLIVGQTYLVAPFAPFYHLNAPILDGDVPVGLSESPEAAVSAWLAGATPHQSMREAADLDALLCGEAPLPVNAPLANIRVPTLLLGAAGGIGEQGLFTLSQLGSTDKSSLIVQRLPPERRAEDFGHADLLFGTDARELAWQPLAAWLLHH